MQNNTLNERVVAEGDETTIIIPIIWMKKLRFKEIRVSVQGYRAHERLLAGGPR